MDLVFANCTTWATATAQIVRDEAWYAEDPLVKARPELFDELPSIVRGTRPVSTGATETATAAPGEKRRRSQR